jgi:heptosyltransferase-1
MRAGLPWGGPHERARSERLSAALPGSVVPPRIDVAEVASVLAHAGCAIGVDTGLTHLAGALGVPTVGIYSATDPATTGLYGCARAVNVGARGRAPGVEDVLAALERVAP